MKKDKLAKISGDTLISIVNQTREDSEINMGNILTVIFTVLETFLKFSLIGIDKERTKIQDINACYLQVISEIEKLKKTYTDGFNEMIENLGTSEKTE